MKFQYYMPTRIVAGASCLAESGQDLKTLGTKAFIMTGASSAERNGSLADAKSALESVGMTWAIYKGVKPNPTLEQVREASEMAKAEGADIVIAIGGGSAMDAAKAVAVLTANDISDDELLSLRAFPQVLPLVAVPTTAGTGSEVTQYSILTNHKKETKSFLVSPQIFPKIAYLDGRYMMELPEFTTAATAIDALSHSAEGYLAVRATPVARAFAMESLSCLASPLKKMLAKETLTLEDREQLLYASMLAGIVIAQSGTTAVHVIGYSLTYFKGTDHGKANGLLMPAYFDFLMDERKEEIEGILEAIGFADVPSFKDAMITLLGEEVIAVGEIDKFSSIAIQAANIANTRPQPNLEDIKKMLSESVQEK